MPGGPRGTGTNRGGSLGSPRFVLEPMAYHHGDLRRALLEGAIELLAEGGPAALTLRGAARRAGVSEAAPYRHFADKKALLAAVAEEGFLALERACSAAAADLDDPVETFWRRGVAYVRFAVQHPAHYRVMFGPEIPDKRSYEGLSAAARAAYEALHSTARACAAVGAFPAQEIEMRATRAWALVHGLASLFIDGQLRIDDEGPGEEAFLEHAAAILALEAPASGKTFSRLPRG